MSLTLTEQIVAEQLEDEGFYVLHRGWPDFLAFDENARVRFVEVKHFCREKMSEHQKQVSEILGLLGIEVEIFATECNCGKCGPERIARMRSRAGEAA